MISQKPCISVIMPLYNKEDSVSRSISSVLAQTILDFELIIINDGSTDNSANVVSQFIDPRIIFVEQLNAGVGAARNRGVMESTSDLVTFLDADDEWYPDYIESILVLAEQYSQCSVYATSYLFKDGDNIVSPSIPFFEKKGIIHDYFYLACKGSPPFCIGSVTVRKSALLSIGLFTPGIMAGEDLLCWAKLAQQYDIAFLNQPKAVYHFPVKLGADHNVRIPDENDVVYLALVALYNAERAGERKKNIKSYIGHWCKMRLHLYVYKGMRAHALTEYHKLLKHSPLNIKAFSLIVLAIVPNFIRRIIFKNASRGMR
ncbi:MAG: hypothetical protein VR73_05930 [Gammaproteobacteria bacterium BRH_c0]|nr:MAG: hypothetical protein VR73_05930 [Gammaproteobacteria bacterium BRH_c0]